MFEGSRFVSFASKVPEPIAAISAGIARSEITFASSLQSARKSKNANRRALRMQRLRFGSAMRSEIVGPKFFKGLGFRAGYSASFSRAHLALQTVLG